MTTALQSPSLINDFADFLGSTPSREEILQWRPTTAVEERYHALVYKRKEGILAPEELTELEGFLNSEIVLSMLKARLRSKKSAST